MSGPATFAPRRCFAPAKINWHLAVGGTRDDGFHALASIFETVTLGDTLEIAPGDRPGLALATPEGIPDDARNTVAKADAALRARIPDLPPLRVTLEKRIPHEAGLGGGSSDAGCYLLAVNALLNLNLDEAALRGLALAAGSDAPFFIRGGRAAVTGRGEVIEWLPDAPPVALLVVMPAARSSTAAAYRALNRPALADCPPGAVPSAADPRSPEFLRTLRNDFASVMPAEVLAPHARIAAFGGLPFLSGSGAASFGVFPDASTRDAALTALTGEFPGLFPARTLGRAEYLAAFR